MKKPVDPLIDAADKLAQKLADAAHADNVSIDEGVKVLGQIAYYLKAKHQVVPEDDGDDPFSRWADEQYGENPHAEARSDRGMGAVDPAHVNGNGHPGPDTIPIAAGFIAPVIGHGGNGGIADSDKRPGGSKAAAARRARRRASLGGDGDA